MNALQASLGTAMCACLVVYIAEAHASDEWPIGPSLSRFSQPRSIAERCALAALTARELGLEWPIAVDDVADSFGEQLGAWPTRLFVFKGRKLIYIDAPLQNTIADFASAIDGELTQLLV